MAKTLAIVVLTLFACEQGARLPSSLRLKAIPLAEVLAPPEKSDTLAILLYDPSDCFSCGSPLGQWLSWGKGKAHQLRVYLTRSPTKGEWAQVVALRAPLEGVVSGVAPSKATPRIYLSVNGGILDSAVGYSAQHRLLGTYRIEGPSIP